MLNFHAVLQLSFPTALQLTLITWHNFSMCLIHPVLSFLLPPSVHDLLNLTMISSFLTHLLSISFKLSLAHNTLTYHLLHHVPSGATPTFSYSSSVPPPQIVDSLLHHPTPLAFATDHGSTNPSSSISTSVALLIRLPQFPSADGATQPSHPLLAQVNAVPPFIGTKTNDIYCAEAQAIIQVIMLSSPIILPAAFFIMDSCLIFTIIF